MNDLKEEFYEIKTQNKNWILVLTKEKKTLSLQIQNLKFVNCSVGGNQNFKIKEQNSLCEGWGKVSIIYIYLSQTVQYTFDLGGSWFQRS